MASRRGSIGKDHLFAANGPVGRGEFRTPQGRCQSSGSPAIRRRDGYTSPVRGLPDSWKRSIGSGGAGLTLLLVRLGAMGDVLRALPALRALRRDLPSSRIFWAVDDRWSPVIDGHPDLDGCIALPRRSIRHDLRSPAGWPSAISALRGFRRALRAERADLAVDFHGNLRSGLVTWWSGAPLRVGYEGHQQKEGNRLFTTHRVPAGERRTSRVERNLELVRRIGIGTGGVIVPGELPLVAAGADRARVVLEQSGVAAKPFVLLSPAASAAQSYKIPSAELFVGACRGAARQGRPVLVVWGPGEQELARAVVASAPEGRALLAPPTDLATLAALLSRAEAFVGADTGPLHLACAVGCPVVALYGPTDPVVNAPWGVPSRVVHPPGRSYTGIKRIDRREGFGGLRADTVEQATEALLTELAAAR